MFVNLIEIVIGLVVREGAGKNRPRTEAPGHNCPNKVGDYVLFTNDYIQLCYMFFVCDVLT